ncbi:MAG: urate hydroxylase PuuD, partial [Woeseiaceae bacterium]
IYLIDPSIAELSSVWAVAIAITYIVGGWVVYDLLCKSPLARDDRVFGAVLLLLVAVLAWSLCQLFSGRGAYIHFGAVLGTIMVANVALVIIPGQRKMVEAAGRGEAPDPAPGIKAKQRSVHNTYFTLPVLFVMISNHYALTYGHDYNWVILIGIALVGALVRVYFVARHKGQASLLPVVIAVLLLAGIVVALAPRAADSNGAAVSFDQVRNVVNSRCTTCHADAPTHAGFAAAPLGVVLDTDERILAEASRIYQQTVVTKAMPIGNLTAMTDQERQIVDQWYKGLQEQ